MGISAKCQTFISLNLHKLVNCRSSALSGQLAAIWFFESPQGLRQLGIYLSIIRIFHHGLCATHQKSVVSLRNSLSSSILATLTGTGALGFLSGLFQTYLEMPEIEASFLWPNYWRFSVGLLFNILQMLCSLLSHVLEKGPCSCVTCTWSLFSAAVLLSIVCGHKNGETQCRSFD